MLRNRRTTLRALAGALLLCLIAPGSAAQEEPEEPEAPPPSDQVIEAAWKKAGKSTRKKLANALEAEVATLDTLQMDLVRELIEAADLNLKRVPELIDAPFYSPKVHTPKLKVKRKEVDPESSAGMGYARRMFAKLPQRALQPAWAYDYGSGQVVQVVEDPADGDRVFANAMAGFAPGLDLAEALAEMAMDDGSQQQSAAAFGHAYSTREGKGYPNITIYDAWCSGTEIEMPDVECLGIVHDVLDDWDTWVSPIPGSTHGHMYGKIEALFTDLRRHRGLRHALAQCYLNGQAVLRDDYDSQIGTFQALWTTVDGPAALAADLPDSEGWRDWLIDAVETMDEEYDSWEAGQERIATLEADREALRPCLVRALRKCRILRE